MQPWPADTECPYEFYPAFKASLNQASYHFADDSGSEWQKGYRHVDEAVEQIINLQMPFWAIRRMVSDAKSLVDFDTFMAKMLKKLYETK